MKAELQICQLKVKKSSIGGYGVFSDQDILTGDVIEECHTLFTGPILSLENYLFNFGPNNCGLLFGFGCIYNHSDEPNATYKFDPKNKVMVFKARRFIKKGEEIFVSYGNNWLKARSIKRRERKSIKYRNACLIAARFLILTSALIFCVYGLNHLRA